MANLFDKRDRWGNSPSLWILAFMVFLVPLAWQFAKRIDLENDVENWLPADDPQAKVLNWYRNHFPIEERFLLTWEGSTLGDPRIPLLAEALEGERDADGVRRNGLPYVESVLTPQEIIEQMVEYEVPRAEAISRLEGVLLGRGMLKIRLTEEGRKRQLTVERELLERARNELGLELQIAPSAGELAIELENALAQADVEPEFAAEDAANLEAAAETAGVSDVSHDFQVSWSTMNADPAGVEHVLELVRSLGRTQAGQSGWVDAAFFVVGAPVALSVELSEAGQEERSEAFAAILEEAAQLGIPPELVRMGGRPVAGEELNRAVVRAAWDRDAPLWQPHHRSVILCSFAVGIFLAFLMLRSVRLATIVILAAFYTMFISLALVPATGGSMNMVLVVMPTLLMVLTMSAAIHVANYWKHAAFHDLRTAVVECCRMARTPCLLASVTTAIGLVSLSTSPLIPVRDFGLYSAVGCLLSLAVVLLGVPALLDVWPGRTPRPTDVDPESWTRLGRFLVRFHVPVTVACLIAFVVGVGGLRYFRTETKVIRYFPEHTRVVQDYNFLEENLAGIIPVNTVVRFDRDAQHELNFLERMEVVRRIQDRMRAHPEISGTISLADFQPVREAPNLEELSGPRKLLEMKKYNTRAQKTEERVKEPGSSAAQLLVVAEDASDLDAPGDHKLNQAGDELWKITAQVAIMSDLNYETLTEDLDEIARSELKLIPGAGHQVTGMVPLFLRTQQAVLESLIRSFGIAFAIIAVVIIVLLRNPLAGLLTMFPNLLPVAVVFGAISWAGLSVDIGTMITASVALGIAVDGTLHLLTWFRIGIREGRTRPEAISEGLAHCGPAMSQTSLAIGVGLLMLYPAELLLISRFGWLMAALIGTALLADIVLLPALLAGPLGYLIERSVRSAPVPFSQQTSATPIPRPHQPPVATKDPKVQIDRG